MVFFNPDKPGTLPADGISGRGYEIRHLQRHAPDTTAADIHWGHFGPRFGFAYQLNNKMVVQAGFAVAFLNGGAYEYGTNKMAVNYGNLLVGSFTRGSTGGNTSVFGSWDTNAAAQPRSRPFSPALAWATQINDFSKK